MLECDFWVVAASVAGMAACQHRQFPKQQFCMHACSQSVLGMGERTLAFAVAADVQTYVPPWKDIWVMA